MHADFADHAWRHLLDPTTLAGAAFYGVLAFVLASIVVLVIRRFSRRLEHRLSDVTVLRFVSLFAQMLVYLAALVLYAHLIPQLRTVGTALPASETLRILTLLTRQTENIVLIGMPGAGKTTVGRALADVGASTRTVIE